MFLVPYLNSDSILRTLLGAPNRIFQLEATDVDKACVVLKVYRYGGDYIKDIQVECRVIVKDFSQGEAICERLDELIVTKKDKPSRVANGVYYRASEVSGYEVKRIDFDGYDFYRVFAINYVKE